MHQQIILSIETNACIIEPSIRTLTSSWFVRAVSWWRGVGWGADFKTTKAT